MYGELRKGKLYLKTTIIISDFNIHKTPIKSNPYENRTIQKLSLIKIKINKIKKK